MQLEKYEYLEKEVFSLQYGVEGIVRKKKEEFESTHRICVAVGVTLCIISAIPLLIAAAFQASELILVYCVDLLLIIVSAAVYLFVWSGMISGSYQKLLQEGDYTEEKKEREKKISPVAGVLFGAICGIINMIHGKSSK